MFSSEDHQKFHHSARPALFDAPFLSTVQGAALLAVLLVCVIGALFVFGAVQASFPEGFDPAPVALIGP
jgi:hypothetical protein